VRRIHVACILVVLSAALVGGAGAEVVFTEGFESPDTSNYVTYNAGESIVTASNIWLVTTSGVDLYEAAARAEAAAYDGAQAVDLTGSPGAGVIETSFGTLPGHTYELVFHYARNNLLGAETGDAEVEVLGAGPLLQAAIQHDPATTPFDNYLEFRDTFVADAASTTLRFTSLDPGNTGITLDGIAISDVTPLPGAGRVPLLLVGKTPTGDVQLDWQPSCSADDGDYAVFGGDLGDFTSHGVETCSTLGTTALVIAQPPGSRYYLVVPLDGMDEGSYGPDGNGAERPVGTTTCGTQNIAASCP